MSEKGNFTRRDFLRGIAVGTVGVAATGALTACASDTGSASGDAPGNQEFDETFDLVIVGSGTVVMAALTAAVAGAKILLVEKGTSFGGTTVFGGGFWAPGNSVQIEKGIEDSAEAGIAYATEAAKAWGGVYDDQTIAAYMGNAPKLMDLLATNYGSEFGSSPFGSIDYFNRPGATGGNDRSLVFLLDGQPAQGMFVWPVFQQQLTEAGVDIRLETPAKSLITDSEGNVVGLIIESDGVEKRIGASKGVILGTGGFDFNPDMTAGFLRAPITYDAAVATNTGDGHLMAGAIGASLINMQSHWGIIGVPIGEEHYAISWASCPPNSIIVNKYGERIGDESGSYPIFCRAFDQWDSGRDEFRNIPAYFICDTEYLNRYHFPGDGYDMGPEQPLPPTIVTAETLDELAGSLGVDPVGLTTTVNYFNADAATGVDTLWHRGEALFDISQSGPPREDLVNNCLGPISTAPFYGIPIYPGSLGTNGGIRTNAQAQALSVTGQPIKGLYAVGNCSYGVFGGAYVGGGATVGSGFVMSYIAANDALGVQ